MSETKVSVTPLIRKNFEAASLGVTAASLAVSVVDV
jgi:hypothetical protein